jgi:integrase
VRDAIHTRHYCYRTEQAYVYWVKDFVRFHGLRHPMQMGEVEVAQFLSHLATRRGFAASTQNQALSTLLFLYKAVLQRGIAFVGDVVRAKTPRRIPVVLTREEVARVLLNLDPPYRLMAQFLYGAGLRLHECLRLRVQDLDTAYGQIVVRDGKGGKDRVTMLPRCRARSRRHSTRSLRRSGCCTAGTSRTAFPGCRCRRRSRASTRMHHAIRAGSTCSRPRG